MIEGNKVGDSYNQWRGEKGDQGYYAVKNEASYGNVDLNIHTERQVSIQVQ